MIDEINGSNQLKDVRIERIMTTSLCTSRANYRPLQRAETQALRALTYENYPLKQKTFAVISLITVEDPLPRTKVKASRPCNLLRL